MFSRLYAIRIALPQDDFNLCPADYCRMPTQANGLADGVSGRGLPVEGYTPPAHVLADVQRLLAAANIEVGGVEYLDNSRDGQLANHLTEPDGDGRFQFGMEILRNGLAAQLARRKV